MTRGLDHCNLRITMSETCTSDNKNVLPYVLQNRSLTCIAIADLPESNTGEDDMGLEPHL